MPKEVVEDSAKRSRKVGISQEGNVGSEQEDVIGGQNEWHNRKTGKGRVKIGKKRNNKRETVKQQIVVWRPVKGREVCYRKG